MPKKSATLLPWWSKSTSTPAQSYTLEDFVQRSRTALTIASDRVQAKYGIPCSLALGQLQKIEQQVNRYQQLNTLDSHVQVIRFTEILHLNKRVLTVQSTAKTRTIRRSATRFCEWCRI